MIAKIKHSLKLKKLKNQLKNAPVKKLNIGAGPDGVSEVYKEWVSVDIDVLDITVEQEWKNLIGNECFLNNILAEHVWEHLTTENTLKANKNCFKYLKKGGKLRIAVPDGNKPDKEYIDAVKPNGSGLGSDDHKILYDYKTMKDQLEMVGFKVALIEYWDESGTFHSEKWEINDGFIKRSKEFDKRNKEEKLVYTSLIVDAIKPH